MHPSFPIRKAPLRINPFDLFAFVAASRQPRSFPLGVAELIARDSSALAPLSAERQW